MYRFIFPTEKLFVIYRHVSRKQKKKIVYQCAQQILVYVTAVCGNCLTGMPGEEQIPVNVFPIKEGHLRVCI